MPTLPVPVTLMLSRVRIGSQFSCGVSIRGYPR